MKRMNSCLANWTMVVACLLAALFVVGPAAAQTTTCQGRQITVLNFRNPVLVSGTPLAVGAVYRFSNVAIGVDALVSIDAFNNGSLNAFDRDTGLIANFQPELNNNNAASADFTISFVVAGGSTPVSLDFTASGIDIDGNNVALREYAEFSLPLTEYVLDNPTQLDVDASGPSSSSRIRFEARTPAVAPGIDPTATGNIVSVFYKNVSTFQYRVGTLGTGNMTRLNSLDFNCPNLNFPTPNPQVDQDFGDAPVSSFGDPRHDIVAGVQMGATNTIETAPYDSPTASGDAGDDGVALPLFVQSASATINVSVAGAGGRLQAWVDWDDDGSFTTPGDQIATDVQDGGVGDSDGAANGTIELNIVTPATASIGQTFARFRWSTQAGLASTTVAPDGEVEDYQAIISATAPPTCPAGQNLVSSVGYADTVVVSAVNSSAALGAPVAAGTPTSNANSARINNGNRTLVLDLTDTVAENAIIEISLAKNNAAGAADIEFSADNVNWTTITNFNAGALDILQRISLTASSGGIRYIRFQRTSGSTHIDGVQYSQICEGAAMLTSDKTVALQDPTGAPFAVPGSDVIYTITVTNVGSGPVDTDSIFMVDDMPAEIEFYNGDIDGGGPETGAIAFSQSSAGLTFSEATDVGYSNNAAAPANFSACNYSPIVGYDPAVTFICFNPKGDMLAGAPDPTFSVSFRARIK